jgi:hypothetical protein
MHLTLQICYLLQLMVPCLWVQTSWIVQAWRESSGTASVSDTQFGDPVQKAEGMAFRRACARFGLGLYLYHEEEVL